MKTRFNAGPPLLRRILSNGVVNYPPEKNHALWACLASLPLILDTRPFGPDTNLSYPDTPLIVPYPAFWTEFSYQGIRNILGGVLWEVERGYMHAYATAPSGNAMYYGTSAIRIFGAELQQREVEGGVEKDWVPLRTKTTKWALWVTQEAVTQGQADDYAHVLKCWVRRTSELVALLSCKNVGLDPIDFHDAATARRWGGKTSGYRYHTIGLRSYNGKKREKGTGEYAGTMPLHICRGHYATYTAAAPLFGRYTGTFYIPAHAKGKKENGESDHTLEVA